MKAMKRTRTRIGKPARRNLPIEGPFAGDILTRARQIAEGYHILLEPDGRRAFRGAVLEIPTVFAHGRSPDQCVAATREVAAVAIATMLEAGVEPPHAGAGPQRTEQMNVRLDPLEKIVLRQAAERGGYRSISDYVRAVALRDARKTG